MNLLRRLPLLLAGGAALSTAAAAPIDGDRMVPLPGGRRMHLICRGQGQPIVLFEGGWGADARSWGRIQAPVAARTRACAYDRAGTGDSEIGPLPRSAGMIADDLTALRTAAGLDGPTIIVAHSLGALPARVLAARPDSRVVGLVLIDPSVEYQAQRMGGSADIFRQMAARSYAKGNLMQGSELEMMPGLSSDEVARAGPPPPGVRVLVLTAGASQTDPAAQARWAALHAMIGGEQRVIPGAGHMLTQEQPQVVADAVLYLVMAERAR